MTNTPNERPPRRYDVLIDAGAGGVTTKDGMEAGTTLGQLLNLRDSESEPLTEDAFAHTQTTLAQAIGRLEDGQTLYLECGALAVTVTATDAGEVALRRERFEAAAQATQARAFTTALAAFN